jgi:hypothetical protein
MANTGTEKESMNTTAADEPEPLTPRQRELRDQFLADRGYWNPI